MASCSRFLIAFLVLGIASTLVASEHFMIVFGVQDAVNSFTGAHTFAAFVEASDEDQLDTKMISWLPASGPVCLFCAAERGRNFPLKESIEEALHRRAKVSAWGPYKIQPELYERAMVRVALLESGGILYKAIDEPQRFDGIATNCEHAVSDIDIDHGYLHTGIAHGNRGSWMVTKHLRRWMIEPGKVHEKIYTALKLDQYPIRRRKL